MGKVFMKKQYGGTGKENIINKGHITNVLC